MENICADTVMVITKEESLFTLFTKGWLAFSGFAFPYNNAPITACSADARLTRNFDKRSFRE